MAWLEVETKIKLPERDISNIRKKVKGIAIFDKKGKKSDDYFAIGNSIKSKYPKKAFRIRKTKEGYEINFKKNKKNLCSKDIVVKREFEFKIRDNEELNDLLTLFTDLGFKRWIKKEKTNETYKYKKDPRASIEINKVKGLGGFIELEYLCKSKEVKKAKKVIRSILKDLKIKESQIDNTGYTKMLWEKKN